MPFSLAASPAVLLNRPDYVDEVLVSHQATFVKGAAYARAKRLLGNGLLTAEGALHTSRRKLIHPAFARPRLDLFATAMVARTRRLVSGWQEGAVVDVTDAMARLTFGIVGETVIGAHVDPFFERVRAAVGEATRSMDTLVSLVADGRQVRGVRARLHEVIRELLAAAPAPAEAGSLLSILAAADGGADIEQQRDDLLTILLAGHDTMTNALAFVFILLAAHPDVEARLRQEVESVLDGRPPTSADVAKLTYARSVVAETLRLYPPAWVIARRALEAHSFDAGVIPAGALVLVSQYLLHRDGRYYDRPLAFDPDRWTPERQASRPRMAYFPFGAGARACIGEGFAWMEGALLLATIVQHCRLRSTTEEAPDLDPRITLRPKDPVMMRVLRAG